MGQIFKGLLVASLMHNAHTFKNTFESGPQEGASGWAIKTCEYYVMFVTPFVDGAEFSPERAPLWTIDRLAQPRPRLTDEQSSF